MPQLPLIPTDTTADEAAEFIATAVIPGYCSWADLENFLVHGTIAAVEVDYDIKQWRSEYYDFRGRQLELALSYTN